MSEELIKFYQTCPEWQLWYVIERMTDELKSMSADDMDRDKITAIRDLGMQYLPRFAVSDYKQWRAKWSHWWDYECTGDDWEKLRQEAVANGIGCFFM